MYTTIISTQELTDLLDRTDDLVVLDCRHDLADADFGLREYLHGHLPNALRADMDSQLSGSHFAGAGRHPWPHISQWREQLAGWRIRPGTQVVLYDQGSGMFAARAWFLLQVSGHPHAAVLDGGFQRWTAEGRQLESGQRPTPEPLAETEFGSVEFDPSRLVDAQGLQDLQLQGWALVDSRAADRYRGENESIDAVAGHIPGALNRPFLHNVNADGTFRSREALRADLLELTGELHAPSQTIFYCGSGVTAAHNLLAMEIAGLHGAALYAASWSGWIEDDTHPISSGDEP